MIINEKQRTNDPIVGCGYLFPVDIESEIENDQFIDPQIIH